MSPVGLPLPPLPPDVVALWATCLCWHGGTPRIDAGGAVWMVTPTHEQVLMWPAEGIDEALVRAAMSAPRGLWGVS